MNEVRTFLAKWLINVLRPELKKRNLEVCPLDDDDVLMLVSMQYLGFINNLQCKKVLREMLDTGKPLIKFMVKPK